MLVIIKPQRMREGYGRRFVCVCVCVCVSYRASGYMHTWFIEWLRVTSLIETNTKVYFRMARLLHQA